MKKRKQTRRRRDAAQRRGKLGISTVIVVLIAVFLLRGHTMDQRNAAYVEELAQLQNKIDAEEARTQDIADLEAYMQTDYTKLTQNDFQATINDYLAYLVKSGEVYEN